MKKIEKLKGEQPLISLKVNELIDAITELQEAIGIMGSEIINGNEPTEGGPMGASQWEAHGKKYGYWEYFMSKLAKIEGQIEGLVLARECIRRYVASNTTEVVLQKNFILEIDSLRAELDKLKK